MFSHDGDALYFATSAALTSKVVRRSLADGTEEMLWEADEYRINGLESVAPDEAWIIYDDRRLTSEANVVLRPLDGAREPRDLIVSEADDRCGQVSPDGRWLAWTSDLSGRYEIYVVPFPQGGSAVQVTSDGGTQPRWHPSGRELFYKASDNALTAVPVQAESGTFAVGPPQRLFQIVEFYGWTHDVAPDGDHFIVREPMEEHDVSPITVLTDWTSLVRR